MSQRLSPNGVYNNNGSSPRREPPKSPTQTPNNLNIAGVQKVNSAGIAAYNGWYNIMNSDWSWFVYTILALVILIGGVFVYNTFMYPSKTSNTPQRVEKTGLSVIKIDPV